MVIASIKNEEYWCKRIHVIEVTKLVLNSASCYTYWQQTVSCIAIVWTVNRFFGYDEFSKPNDKHEVWFYPPDIYDLVKYEFTVISKFILSITCT